MGNDGQKRWEEKRLRWEREEEKRLRRKEEERGVHAEKEQHHEEKEIVNSIGMKFTHILAGEFMMGSDESELEQPVHKVKIEKPFYLGTYPVTQREWMAIMGDNPSYFKGDDRPIEQVSWNDARDFVKKLNEKEGTDKYRLPSEAEWEYAARAGTTTLYSFGNDESDLGHYAWYDSNSGSKTHSVGQKQPNPWGLYDMHGNVWEWVRDRWHSDYDGAPTDGSAWEGGSSSFLVARGGGWGSYAKYCRSVNRGGDLPAFSNVSFGFRLLQEL
ncbi:MAG: formylglycine-generating enzyme family protein [Candidatus Eremiobacteraeota bacterium]|nr:formylglycine-generating enzyme family protein [Candidatus Eremiobacteraeota bacterium]